MNIKPGVALFLALSITACAHPGGGKLSPVANTTEVAVGETEHLTVYLDRQCGKVPSFADVSKELPHSKIIRYSDGGPGTRDSRRCNGVTEGRSVLATGIAPGLETHDYQAGRMTVIVK